MDGIYVKAALYMYTTIPRRVKEIDNIIYEKALDSRRSTTLEVADDIIRLKLIKRDLIDLRSTISSMLSTMDADYLDCIYYKYFQKLKHTYSETFDYRSRGYFRMQNAVIRSVTDRLVLAGFNDGWFLDNGNDPFVGAAVEKAIYIEESNTNNKKRNKK